MIEVGGELQFVLGYRVICSPELIHLDPSTGDISLTMRFYGRDIDMARDHLARKMNGMHAVDGKPRCTLKVERRTPILENVSSRQEQTGRVQEESGSDNLVDLSPVAVVKGLDDGKYNHLHDGAAHATRYCGKLGHIAPSRRAAA
jgi:hypothetical protein